MTGVHAMIVPSRRNLVLLCGVTLAVISIPTESKAIFHWFGGGCCGRTTFAPTTTFCNPCGAQTCQYVPQTCFRQQVVNVPVTVMQPVASCNPCGGMTTVMRPVTTFRQQVQMVPYSSYRLVYSNPVVASPVTTSFMIPAPATTSSCCSSSVAPATFTAPPDLGTHAQL